jgi:hypothetical protein
MSMTVFTNVVGFAANTAAAIPSRKDADEEQYL